MKLYLCVSIALSLLGAALSSSLDDSRQRYQRAYDDLDALYSPSDWTYMQDDDTPETDSVELETNEVDSNAELDEYMNEIQYQAHKPRMDDEVELQNYLSCTQTNSKSGVLHGGKIALQLLYEKKTWLGCSAPKYCEKTTCPRLYMEGDDWKNCPAEVFKIYRAAGPGTVEVGDVVGLYVGDGKWFSVYQARGSKSPCPGTPSTQHGFATSNKWSECWAEVFQIYANRKEIGDPIQDHDNIFLYYEKDKKWVASATQHPGLDTCPGTTRPPPPDRYDTCLGAVFELWKG